MLVTHTYIEKSNTIIEGTAANTGLNPVMELYYGNMHTRCLMYFNHKKVKDLIEDKTYLDPSKLKHVLKLWNVADIDISRINCPLPDSFRTEEKERATSFDLVLFLVPNMWDEGRGFDFKEDRRPEYRKAYSEYGSNWYYRTTIDKWEKPGIYTRDELAEMIDNNDERIIGIKHFDFGNEQFEMDITDVFNKFIDGTLENYGLCLSFTPEYEIMREIVSQYVGFFSNRTNTFFEPFVETTYDDVIKDDRINFYLDKPNKLYFYANIGGNNVNLDELPMCEFNGVNMPVKQATKGVYYVDTYLTNEDVSPNTMLYDTWTNIKYQGRIYPDAELSVTTKESERYYTFGLPFDTQKHPKFKPILYGIKEGEELMQGEKRKINVECKILYTPKQEYPFNSLQYRLYIRFADREYNVIDWQDCDTIYTGNSFFITTNELVPHEYHIDIKVKYDEEELITKDALRFTILSDARKRE